jgi:flagellar basal body-associated protein FliL
MDLIQGLLIYVSVVLTLIVVVGVFFLMAASRSAPTHAPSYNEIFAAQQESAKEIARVLKEPLADALNAAVTKAVRDALLPKTRD